MRDRDDGSDRKGGFGRVDRRLLDELTGRLGGIAGAGPPLQARAPVTGALLAELPRFSPEDVSRAAAAARAAQEPWAATRFRDRAVILMAVYDLLLAEREQAQDLIQLETGKARRDAFEEVADVALVARYYARTGARHLRPRRRRGLLPVLTAAREYRVPLGVVGIIAPWNYPLTLAVSDALPALAAGNAVLLKPDPRATLTALWAARLLERAGLPVDLFQVVTGDGPEVGPALIGAVDFVGFTGSSETGRLVARQAGEALVPCSLELGGKNPLLVLEDADLERALEGVARACYSNAGQLCVSAERLLVHERVYDDFVERFRAIVAALRLGASADSSTDVGSLTSGEVLAKVEAHVADATEKGARVLAGGRRRPDLGPLFYEPTLLEGVTEDMRVHSEETFGPVAWVQAFASDDEAVALANATAYGLNASIWTRDSVRGRRLARRIRAGSVAINDGYAAVWGSSDLPMGGRGASGFGRRHGAEGILKYTASQGVVVQRGFAAQAPPGASAVGLERLWTRALGLLRRLPLRP